MTRIDKVLKKLSDLYEFNRKLKTYRLSGKQMLNIAIHKIHWEDAINTSRKEVKTKAAKAQATGTIEAPDISPETAEVHCERA